VLENGEAVNEEVDLTLWGDERRHYREAIEPMRDQTGKVVGIIGAATDITEHQRLKQQLTDDIGFRERMMGVLSHDLRNPLNAITMAADLLLRVEDRQERERAQLQRIRRAADRMKEMIETLLDFTRLRYLGAFPTTPAAVDLGNIARVVVDELAGSRPGSHVELRVEGDLHGEWDPARVAQAISNLVGNALAYGTPGTVVDVLVKGEGDDVFVRVTNQGEPIPSALKAVLFEPFRRGVIGDRSPHGLGLGLYIVNAIVTAHGGEIHVESTVDVGTTFTIRLPRKAAAPIND
jgi:signal transduction histidine kinase